MSQSDDIHRPPQSLLALTVRIIWKCVTFNLTIKKMIFLRCCWLLLLLLRLLYSLNRQFESKSNGAFEPHFPLNSFKLCVWVRGTHYAIRWREEKQKRQINKFEIVTHILLFVYLSYHCNYFSLVSCRHDVVHAVCHKFVLEHKRTMRDSSCELCGYVAHHKTTIISSWTNAQWVFSFLLLLIIIIFIHLS